MSLEPAETPPPEKEKIDELASQLDERKERSKLNDKKIELFSYTLRRILIVLYLLIALFAVAMVVYFWAIFTDRTPPSNFWHIPLIIALIISTILSSVLILTAKFGDQKQKK